MFNNKIWIFRDEPIYKYVKHGRLYISSIKPTKVIAGRKSNNPHVEWRFYKKYRQPDDNGFLGIIVKSGGGKFNNNICTKLTIDSDLFPEVTFENSPIQYVSIMAPISELTQYCNSLNVRITLDK